VAGQPAGPSVGVAQGGDGAAQDALWVHVGDHQMATGAQHARELREGRAEIGDVGQRQPAGHEIGGRVGDRQLAEVAAPEVAARDVRACPGEHVG
jgi:hypothetical protein